ncbi:MAG TPA: DNA methyltransferase, partial [Bacillales bacterium]
KERVGYPTQKPLALLERIIKSCTQENDIVLDPFCGCGTAIVGAEKLKRKWIGIDITHLAITVIRERLNDVFGFMPSYISKGEPVDLDGAYDLANNDRFQFQIWALALLGIRTEMKKGADGGVDGVQYFENGKELKKCIIQVKSGKVSVKDVRELHSVVLRENGETGLLVTLKPPTRNMVKEASTYGLYQTNRNESFPVIQIVEVKELLKHEKALKDFIPV